MVEEQPTPEEAARALREVSDRRNQALARASKPPRWIWWLLAAVVLVHGVGEDLLPNLRTLWTGILVLTSLFLAFAVLSKRLRRAIGYRASPRIGHGWEPPDRVHFAVIALSVGTAVVMIGLPWLLEYWQVSWPNSITSIVLAVLLVAALPRLMERIRSWWERLDGGAD